MDSDTRPLGSGPRSEFTKACEKLHRLFAGVLGDLKIRSCSAAWSEIKKAKSTKRKREILEEKAHQWRENSAEAIRNWLPKFVGLAIAYPEAAGGNQLQWAREKVWKAVESQCGIRCPEQGGTFRFDRVSRTIVYWFAVASEGNFEVNLSPQRPWTAPRWLAIGERETSSLLREHSQNLTLRLDHVISEALDMEEIDGAINRANRVQRQPQDTVQAATNETPAIAQPINERQSSAPKPEGDPVEKTRREAVISKVRNPQTHTILSIIDAALYFEVGPRTIHRWKNEGKLRNGARRGSITIESILQWQKKRSRKHPTQ